jgi:hypothetical protein
LRSGISIFYIGRRNLPNSATKAVISGRVEHLRLLTEPKPQKSSPLSEGVQMVMFGGHLRADRAEGAQSKLFI